MSADARRAGLLVLLASFVGHAGNYLYYVVAARMVTPVEFAAISALISLGTITWMPINGIQMAIARNVAALGTSATAGELSAYLRQTGRRMVLVCLGIAAVIAGLSPLLADRLHFASAHPLVLAAVWVGSTSMLIVVTGMVQGMERFGYLAFAYAGPLGALRTLLLPLCVLAAGMAGSMWAMILATVIGLAVMMPPIARAVKVAPTTAPTVPSTLVTMVGLLAFSSLTNVDVLVGQAALDEAHRVQYAGAVLLGKIALFAPQALALVLLPRVTAALERGEAVDRSVLNTLALTFAAGAAVAAALWVMPTSLITLTFGPGYEASKALMPAIALVMTGAAVLWVHLTFAIARRSGRWIAGLVVVAVAHWGLLAVLHDSPWHIVLASGIAVAAALLVIEAGSRGGVVRMVLNSRKGVPERTGS